MEFASFIAGVALEIGPYSTKSAAEHEIARVVKEKLCFIALYFDIEMKAGNGHSRQNGVLLATSRQPRKAAATSSVAPAKAVVAERPRTETTETVTLEPIEDLLERASLHV